LIKGLQTAASHHFNTTDKQVDPILAMVESKIDGINESFKKLPFFVENMIMKFSKDPSNKCAGTRDPAKMRKVIDAAQIQAATPTSR